MLFDCPQCGLPCEVAWQASAASTGGRLEHVYVRCAARHWFLAPPERLGITGATSPGADGESVAPRRCRRRH
jgi:hypothetical protein